MATLKNKIKILDNDIIKLEEIIRPFVTEDLTKKQSVELCQTGKFISLLGNQIKIIERRESPNKNDFKISFNGEYIGLEHEQIFNSENVKNIKSVDKLFSDSALLFSEKYPDIKILANIWLNTDRLDFKKGESLVLKLEIVEYVHCHLMKDRFIKKPDFIDDIMIMNHSKVSFKYNPGGYYVNNIKPEELLRAINKKEKLLKQYQKNIGIM